MQQLHGQSGHQSTDHALSVVLLCRWVARLAHRQVLEARTEEEVNIRSPVRCACEQAQVMTTRAVRPHETSQYNVVQRTRKRVTENFRNNSHKLKQETKLNMTLR